MKRNLIAACVLSFALTALVSAQAPQASAQNGAHYTKNQLKQMVLQANTPDQYNTLAAYYGNQQAGFLNHAAVEEQEWIRRSQNIMSIAAKYPRPVDSARYLYEYYKYKASETGSLAAKYGQLATQGLPAKAN
jgi:hypothetical protein